MKMERNYLYFKKAGLFCVIFLVFCFISGYSAQDTQKYTLVFGDKEKVISGVRNDKGILLVPLNATADMLGYTVKACDECLMDSMYNLEEIKANKEDVYTSKRKIYVNWFENIVTFEIDARVVALDAKTERINKNITYTSLKLYEYLGYSYDVDEANKTIRINSKKDEAEKTADTGSGKDVNPGVQDKAATNEGKEKTTVPEDNEKKANAADKSSAVPDSIGQAGEYKFTEIIYALDLNCSSCKETTALLEEYKQKYKINIVNIDTALEANKAKLEPYYARSSVPAELKNIYPMVFIGDQYLFFKEINKENIGKSLRGESVKHSFDTEVTAETKNPIPDSTDRSKVIDNGIEKKLILYFYSPTCASCRKADSFMNQIADKYTDLEIKKYSIADINNMKLLKEYGKYYQLPADDIGNIPAVFISGTALVGDEQISNYLEDNIKVYNSPTPLLNAGPLEADTGIYGSDRFKFTTVLGAGLVNGINPCSLSMLLFLLSLIAAERKQLLKIGIAFCVGKFLMFFLLGTLFYKLFSLLNLNWVDTVVKTILIVIIAVFVVLNVNDFIAARMEKYNKIILQLPGSVRGMYQGFMKKIAGYSESKYIVLIMALFGMLLALGEFICTGQIYLSSIVFLVQSQSQGIIPILYLLLYSFAFIVPLLIVTLFVFYGKKVFNLSEKLLVYLPVIKIISAVFFLAFGIYVILFV